MKLTGHQTKTLQVLLIKQMASIQNKIESIEWKHLKKELKSELEFLKDLYQTITKN
jgi:hypothetical protein